MKAMCGLGSPDAVKLLDQPKAYLPVEPLQVVQFISVGFQPMNEMNDRTDLSKRDIFNRTKAVFEYFSLFFDAEGP